MTNKDLIHLKFEYQDALESKRDLLNLEKSFMLMAKSVHSYASTRKKELKKRVTLARKFRELNTLLRKIHREMPEIHVPKIAGHEINLVEESAKAKIPASRRQSKSQDDIESQLQDIQRKLRQIGK